jgi:hypothetical protein
MFSSIKRKRIEESEINNWFLLTIKQGKYGSKATL